MNNSCRTLCIALLAVPMGAIAADEKGCDSVNWGKEVLDKFPNAEKACHGVTMKNDNLMPTTSPRSLRQTPKP